MTESNTQFQDLETEAKTGTYVDLDPNDPEILKLRREAGDPTVANEGVAK